MDLFQINNSHCKVHETSVTPQGAASMTLQSLPHSRRDPRFFSYESHSKNGEKTCSPIIAEIKVFILICH